MYQAYSAAMYVQESIFLRRLWRSARSSRIMFALVAAGSSLECAIHGEWLSFHDWLVCRGVNTACSKHAQTGTVHAKYISVLEGVRGMKEHHGIACLHARALVTCKWDPKDPKCCLVSCGRPTGLWIPYHVPGQEHLGGYTVSDPQKTVMWHMQRPHRRWTSSDVIASEKQWLVVCSPDCCKEAKIIMKMLTVRSTSNNTFEIVLGVDHEAHERAHVRH